MVYKKKKKHRPGLAGEIFTLGEKCNASFALLTFALSNVCVWVCVCVSKRQGIRPAGPPSITNGVQRKGFGNQASSPE